MGKSKDQGKDADKESADKPKPAAPKPMGKTFKRRGQERQK